MGPARGVWDPQVQRDRERRQLRGLERGDPGCQAVAVVLHAKAQPGASPSSHNTLHPGR